MFLSILKAMALLVYGLPTACKSLNNKGLKAFERHLAQQLQAEKHYTHNQAYTFQSIPIFHLERPLFHILEALPANGQISYKFQHMELNA